MWHWYLKLNAHVNPTRLTTFSSLFADPLQSALVSHAQHSLHCNSVKENRLFCTTLAILQNVTIYQL